MAEDKNVRDWDRILIRVPDGIKELIAKRAKMNDRSMNSEIIEILEDALYDGDPTEAALTDEWTELRKWVESQEQELEAAKVRMAWLDQQIALHRAKNEST